jgi:ribonuclease Z
VAKAAGVKTLVIFHHDPLHSDAFLDRVGEQARQAFPGAIVAREGLSIPIKVATATETALVETAQAAKV